jgi:hypothetical protein
MQSSLAKLSLRQHLDQRGVRAQVRLGGTGLLIVELGRGQDAGPIPTAWEGVPIVAVHSPTADQADASRG